MEKKKNKSFVRRFLSVQTLIFVLVIVFTIILTQDYFFSFSPLKRFESNLLDARFTKRGPLKFKDSSKVIIISISQESSKALPEPYNTWPWPRSIYARLIKNLNVAGVKAIGIDLVMSGQDRFDSKNDSLLMNTIRKYKNVVVAGEIPAEKDNGNYFKERYIYNKNYNFDNMFFRADSSIGIVNIMEDNDGVVRRYSPVWRLPFEPPRDIPSFAFAVLNKYFHKSYNYTAEQNNNNFLYNDHLIPQYDNSSFLINYYGASGTFPNIDIINVIDDHEFQTADEKNLGTQINLWDDPQTGLLHTGILKNKIVLVGSFDPLEKDYINIPYSSGKGNGGNLIFGVEVYANVIQSILDNNFLYKEPASLEIILIFVFTFLSFYSRSLFKKFKIKNAVLNEALSLLTSVILTFCIYKLSFYFFDHFNYVITVTSPLLAVAMGYVSSTTYHFITERRQSIFLKKMFSQYVNKNLLDELIADPSQLKLGGERRVLTVFFSDIAGFTNLSEKKNSEELVTFLNEYLMAMTEVIFNYGGTLDKYQGDAIMAFWGAPVQAENHAEQCCRAALMMKKRLNELQRKWEAEGQAIINVRMGINTGEMTVGNMGGMERFDYTVIGDNVNLASRLEGVNKEYGTGIIISEATYEEVKDLFFARELDYIIVKGKTKPIKIYELLASKDESLSQNEIKSIKCFEAGLEKYRKKEFAEAENLFEMTLKINPQDSPSLIFQKRCEAYKISPPPEDWDGVYVMTHK
jgi:adenylate cyclase